MTSWACICPRRTNRSAAASPPGEYRHGEDAVNRTNQLTTLALAVYKLRRYEEIRKELIGQNLLTKAEDARLDEL